MQEKRFIVHEEKEEEILKNIVCKQCGLCYMQNDREAITIFNDIIIIIVSM